jgi:hypothetical protein
VLSIGEVKVEQCLRQLQLVTYPQRARFA